MSANEEVGSGFKTGGQELRGRVAEKLAAAAEAGERPLEGLLEVARQALRSPEARDGEQRAKS
jgi:hypothetical protein